MSIVNTQVNFSCASVYALLLNYFCCNKSYNIYFRTGNNNTTRFETIPNTKGNILEQPAVHDKHRRIPTHEYYVPPHSLSVGKLTTLLSFYRLKL